MTAPSTLAVPLPDLPPVSFAVPAARRALVLRFAAALDSAGIGVPVFFGRPTQGMPNEVVAVRGKLLAYSREWSNLGGRQSLGQPGVEESFEIPVNIASLAGDGDSDAIRRSSERVWQIAGALDADLRATYTGRTLTTLVREALIVGVDEDEILNTNALGSELSLRLRVKTRT